MTLEQIDLEAEGRRCDLRSAVTAWDGTAKPLSTTETLLYFLVMHTIGVRQQLERLAAQSAR